MHINNIFQAVFLISICLLFCLIILAKKQTVYYVSPNGNDNNPGTLIQPFATIEKARDIARTINKNMTGDIIINLASGVYELSSTFYLTSNDSGTNGYKIIYQANKGESPIISGGNIVRDWLIYDSKKDIYKVDIDPSIDTRRIWVNGWCAIRARSNDASGWSENGDGYDCPDIVSEWKNISKVEIVSRTK